MSLTSVEARAMPVTELTRRVGALVSAQSIVEADTFPLLLELRRRLDEHAAIFVALGPEAAVNPMAVIIALMSRPSHVMGPVTKPPSHSKLKILLENSRRIFLTDTAIKNVPYPTPLIITPTIGRRNMMNSFKARSIIDKFKDLFGSRKIHATIAQGILDCRHKPPVHIACAYLN